MIFNNGTEITNLRNVQRFPDGAFLLLIDLKTPTDPLESVEYVARDGDVAGTGQWIYQQIVEGNFEGEITDWVPPPPLTVEEVSEMIRQSRNGTLTSVVDPVVSNPLRWNEMSETEQQAWTDYRRALLDLPQDPDFPWYTEVMSAGYVDLTVVPWPTRPM
jgi:hypothetical protein